MLPTERKQSRNPTQNLNEEPDGDEILESINGKPITVPLGQTPGPNAWELYNDKARLFDQEMLKEWEGNLSILLVFVRLHTLPKFHEERD